MLIDNPGQGLGVRYDTVYLGLESPAHQEQFVQQYQSHPLLTIAENNSQCISGSDFRLQVVPNRMSFSVNLDSVSRNGVRINPNVLLLARPRNAYHE